MTLHSNWWALALRGLAAAIIGLLTFLLPGITLFALVVLFGGFCIINGLLTLVAAFRRSRDHSPWWLLALEGLASVAAGVLTLAWPHITLVGLLMAVAVWAIVTGLLQIGTAVRLRKRISGEWVMLLSGLLSVVFGVLVLFRPITGALAISWWIAAYLFTSGIIMAILAFRLRRHGAEHNGGPTSRFASAAG